MSTHSRRLSLGVVLVVALAGCRGGSPPVLEVVLPDGAEVLDFGAVTVGERAHRDILLRNLGPGAVVVDIADWVGASPEVFGFSLPSPAEIPAGGVLRVTLAFAPERPGAYVATLRLGARAGSGEVSAFVMMEGAARTPPGVSGPRIAVVPYPTLNLGVVPFVPEAPAMKRTVLRVFNVGSVGSLLRIEGVEISAGTEGTKPAELKVTLGAEAPEGGLPAELGTELTLNVRFTPGSLGDKRWNLRLISNDPEQPELVLEVTASVTEPGPCLLKVTPSSVSMGVLQRPDYRDVGVTVENIGTLAGASCVLWNFRVQSGSFPGIHLLDAPSAPLLLEPGAKRSFGVRVHAVQTGPVSGAVIFDTSAEAQPEFSIPIAGEVPEWSCLVVSPDEGQFGDVRVGCPSVTRTFLVYNTCPSPVVFKDMGMGAGATVPAGTPGCEGTAPCPEFILVQAPEVPPGGLSLGPATPPLTIKVKYRPLDVGADSASVWLVFELNEGPRLYVIPLKGAGDGDRYRTDVYTQPVLSKVDLLLAIDTAPSMAAHQGKLATNLALLRNRMAQFSVDAHVAVISADPADGALFRSGTGHPATVLANMSGAAFVSEFDQKTAVGTSGSGSRECLEQAISALTPPLSQNQNAGFLRPGANLSVICFTDGEDESPGAVADYVAELEALATTAAFNVIGAASATCPGDSARLAAVALQTGGLAEEICTYEFEISGPTLNSFRSTFYLTSPPDLGFGPLEVELDGVSVAPVDTNGVVVWTYVPSQNAIVFEPGHYPAQGSTITVTYAFACHS